MPRLLLCLENLRLKSGLDILKLYLSLWVLGKKGPELEWGMYVLMEGKDRDLDGRGSWMPSQTSLIY